MPNVKWRMSNSRLLLAFGIRHLPLTLFSSLVGLRLCTVRFKAATGISDCVEVEGRHAGPSTRSPRPKSTVTGGSKPREDVTVAIGGARGAARRLIGLDLLARGLESLPCLRHGLTRRRLRTRDDEVAEAEGNNRGRDDPVPSSSHSRMF